MIGLGNSGLNAAFLLKDIGADVMVTEALDNDGVKKNVLLVLSADTDGVLWLANQLATASVEDDEMRKHRRRFSLCRLLRKVKRYTGVVLSVIADLFS